MFSYTLVLRYRQEIQKSFVLYDGYYMSVGKCFERNKNQSLTILLKIFMLIICNTYNDVQFITMYCWMEMKVILKKIVWKYFLNEEECVVNVHNSFNVIKNLLTEEVYGNV